MKGKVSLEMFSMSKAAITRLFLAAVAVAVIGALIVLAAVVSALASGLFVIGGPSVVAVNGTVAWTLVAPLLMGSLAIGAAAVAAIVSWIGALLATAKLDDKTWFVALLVLGLFSLGWVALVAYIVAGPDGTNPSADGVATGTTAAA